MRIRHATTCSFLSLAACAATFGQVQLSEIRTDEQGTDKNEYVELSGTPGASLDGITLIVIGDQGSGTTKSGFVEFRWTFGPSDVIGGSGFLLLRKVDMNTVVPMPFFEPSIAISPDNGTGVLENSDNTTYMLVTGYSGTNAQGGTTSAGQDLDTNDDGVLDITPWTEVLDSVSLKLTVGDVPGTQGTNEASEWWYSETVVGPNPNRSVNGTTGEVTIFQNPPAHAFRDGGTGEWRYGPFNTATGINLDTPGAPNFVTPKLACGASAAGDCLANHEDPFCADSCCCDFVCAADAYCCEFHWDALCATKANECAGVCTGGGCPADLDFDTTVGGADLGILLSSWGTGDADLDGDGTVAGSDLGQLLAAWGSCPR